MSLKTYRHKRDFNVTHEPRGTKVKPRSSLPIFVIQKHNATHQHYDFRLEIGDVLKSWAVPKGIPEKPHDKRLAIETEDHPLEYASFAGEIPHGEYGGGTVEIWDKGTFENISTKDGKAISAQQALKEGTLIFRLNGNKLQGQYVLIFFKEERNREWLLMKKVNDL
jgi:DNA ligase D-like protein (predicted 3'-phosphoesterase)